MTDLISDYSGEELSYLDHLSKSDPKAAEELLSNEKIDIRKIAPLLNRPTVPIDAVLNAASREDPDTHAELLKIAESEKLPIDYIREDKNEILLMKKLREMDLEDIKKSPVLSNYLADFDNAAVSHDDIPVLRSIEETLAGVDRSWAEVAADSSLDLLKGMVGQSESIIGLFDLTTGNRLGDILSKIGWEPERANEILSRVYTAKRAQANRKVQEAAGFINTLGAMIEEPSASLGTVIESAPMMMSTAGAARLVAMKLITSQGLKWGTPAAKAYLSRPEVFAKITMTSAGAEGAFSAGSIQEQARIQGVPWSESVLPSLSAGVLTALIGKYSSKILPDVEAQAAVQMFGREGSQRTILGMGKAIASGMFKEGVEELSQSLQEQIFTNLATGRPWDEDVPEAAAQGLVVGAGMGGGMSSMSSVAGALSSAVEKSASTESVSKRQQVVIDKIIGLAEESTTNSRAPERFSSFMQSAGVGAVEALYVDPEIVEGLDDIPDFMEAQIEEEGRTEIKIPVEKLATEVVKNKKLLEAIRPHLRLTPESMTQAEIEAGEITPEIRNLVERLVNDQEIYSDIEDIQKDVVSQLVETYRYSPETARYNAQVISAYVATKAKQHGISAQQVFEDMGLRIVRDDTPTKGAVFNQQYKVEQDFGGIIIEEDVILPSGEEALARTPANAAWKDAQDRRKRITEVLRCINE